MNDFSYNPKQYDPRMHTAEHVLNQTMVRMFSCGRAFSAHIETKKSKCDYRMDRNLTAEEVAEVERRVNDVLRQNLPVRERMVERSEAATLFDLSRLPEEAGQSIRIITVGEYDACPCSGIHASSTGEVGTFSIISTDHQNGFLRVRFRLT